MKTSNRLLYAAAVTGALVVFLCVSCRSSEPTQQQTQAQTASAKPEKHSLASFSQEITSPLTEFSVKRGSSYPLTVTVKNTGSENWVAGDKAMEVTVGYRWVNKGAVLPFEGTRGHLTRDLAPGESETVTLQVIPEAPPGNYDVWVSMVQEGVAWFIYKGTNPLVLHATIK